MKKGQCGQLLPYGIHRQSHIVFDNRPVSWMAVFNAMPTICFGFQVPAPGSLLSH